MRTCPSEKEANTIDDKMKRLERNKLFQQHCAEEMLNKHMDAQDIEEAHNKFC